jgi:hypothetical protein
MRGHNPREEPSHLLGNRANNYTEVRESPELNEMWNTTNNFNSGRNTNTSVNKNNSLI